MIFKIGYNSQLIQCVPTGAMQEHGALQINYKFIATSIQCRNISATVTTVTTISHCNYLLSLYVSSVPASDKSATCFHGVQ